MARREARTIALRRALYALLAVALAAGLVGGAFAVRNIVQARRLLGSQRLRFVLRVTEPGQPPDLLLLPGGVRPDRIQVRTGPQPGERTEVRTYAGAQVTLVFTPAYPDGLVSRITGKLPAMAWPPGRRPRATFGGRVSSP
jgi:hypothetical protein